MKNIKTYIVAATMVGLLGVTGTAFAAANSTPAEITAGLTETTVDKVNAERVAGKTFGAIAGEAGKLDEFKAQILEQKKALLDQRVADGTLTKEKANEIFKSITTNQATCDGTGTAKICKNTGAGFGLGQGMGNGAGQRNGGGGLGGGMGRGSAQNN